MNEIQAQCLVTNGGALLDAQPGRENTNNPVYYSTRVAARARSFCQSNRSSDQHSSKCNAAGQLLMKQPMHERVSVGIVVLLNLALDAQEADSVNPTG